MGGVIVNLCGIYLDGGQFRPFNPILQMECDTSLVLACIGRQDHIYPIESGKWGLESLADVTPAHQLAHHRVAAGLSGGGQLRPRERRAGGGQSDCNQQSN